MSRVQMLLLVACLIAVSVGCRNRCYNPYGGGLVGNNSRIAPPGTYSLNIPSVANNQPYYTPGSAAPNNYTVNPNLRAPTPANRTANQNGWRPVNGNDLSNANPANQSNQNNQPAPNNAQPRSVLAPTTFVQGQQINNTSARTASNTGLPGTGGSFVNSQNYQTTQVDERRDSTRLPVTDASAVRAPARNFPTGNAVQLVSQPVNYPAAYQQPIQQTYVAQNGFYQQAAPVYSGNVAVVRQPVTYQGNAVLVNPNNGFISPPAVLGQSTATIPNTTGVWTQRELSSGRLR